jgi:hypothetical protein
MQRGDGLDLRRQATHPANQRRRQKALHQVSLLILWRNVLTVAFQIFSGIFHSLRAISEPEQSVITFVAEQPANFSSFMIVVNRQAAADRFHSANLALLASLKA